MRSFLMRKINNFTKTLSLRAKVTNIYGARLYIILYLWYKFIYLVAAVLPTARGAADICRGEGADIKYNFLTTIY